MGTHPDIALAVGAVSKFCSNLTKPYSCSEDYVKKAMNIALKYYKDENPVTGFSACMHHADWGGDLDYI